VHRNAYTIIELLIVVVVVGIVAAVAWPDAEAGLREQARLAAERFENDVDYAKSLSIRDPSDPAGIKIEPDNNRYFISKKSAPETPINHPVTKKPYVVQYGPGGTPGLDQVTIEGADLGGDSLIFFEATGILDQSTPAVLQVKAGGAEAEIVLAPVGTDTKVGEVFTKTVTLLPTEVGGKEGPTEIILAPK
jgi:prepilin-type N-terminal cleavage/methylation domain-containing protein